MPTLPPAFARPFAFRALLPLCRALAAALCLAFLPAGCATPAPPGPRAGEVSLSLLAGRIWDFARDRPGGFTVDVRTLDEPAAGIAVSYAATQDSHSREALESVVGHALRHDGLVGGWFNPEDGLYNFDSTRLFPEDRLEDALRFGRENGQQAVYVLSTGTEIPVGPGNPD